jgi:hypothetical protein
MAAAAVVTLVRPGAWALALAGFLARGGIVLVAAPIVVLPTPAGIQNALGGPVAAMLLGTPPPELVALLAGLVLLLLAVVVGGHLVGAWAERAGIGLALEAAADEGIAGAGIAGAGASGSESARLDGDARPDEDSLAGAPGAGRIAVVRLLGLVPLGLVLAASVGAIYDATYRELILPDELRTPLPVRILAAAPVTFAALGCAWVVGDAAASMGVRRLVLERRRLGAAWALGWWDLARRLPRVLGTMLVTLAVLAVCVGPGLLAAAVGWEQVRVTFLEGGDPVGMTIAVLLWVAAWLGALVLTAVGAAFRNAAWTFTARRPG